MKIRKIRSAAARSAASYCQFGGCVSRTTAASCVADHPGYRGAHHADGEGAE
jgi:hypothetical protein